MGENEEGEGKADDMSDLKEGVGFDFSGFEIPIKDDVLWGGGKEGKGGYTWDMYEVEQKRIRLEQLEKDRIQFGIEMVSSSRKRCGGCAFP